jgi:hypothetical protein
MSQPVYLDYRLFDNYFDLKVIIWSRISKIIRSFNLHIELTHVIFRINRDLNTLFLITEGVKAIINDKKIEGDTVKIHSKYKKALFAFRHTITILENVNFFRNPTTRKLCNNILDNYYTIEYQLRKIAYPETNNNQTEDQELLEFASSISLGSL